MIYLKSPIVNSIEIALTYPNYFVTKIRRDVLEDEVTFVKLYQSVTDYLSFEVDRLSSSAWLDFPKYYKYTGLELSLSFDQQVTQRETYDFLEYIGDLGGLFEGLTKIFTMILAPIVGYSLDSYIAQTIFMVKPKSPPKTK